MSAVLSQDALKLIDARYLAKEVGEQNSDEMWDRVSGGNAEYRNMMSDLYFLPNSPTLFNAGLKKGGTLSACFVFDVLDTLNGDWPDGGLELPTPDSIIGTLFKASTVAKAGGGVGYYLGNIRHKGSPVNSVHRKACGPVEVLKLYHRLRSLITQGGKRDLAQMAVLPCWHKDILEFIHCKDQDPKSLESFNISVSWKDEWLKNVNFDTPYKTLSDGTVVDLITTNHETHVWREQCQAAWRTGCPGNFFWDTVNYHNPCPHIGDINAPNPCGETPNITDEPCNLGSLAIVRFLKAVANTSTSYTTAGGLLVERPGRPSLSIPRFDIDWPKLKDYIKLSIKFLDDILDWNVFPHPQIAKAAMLTRKLGLGVMGWADLLALMRIPYDTEDAVQLGEEIMSFINKVALDESIHLADIKGPYPAWDIAPDEIKARFPRCRNSTRTSIAPTGSIAIIANVWGSIEPHYAEDCERTTHEGLKLNDGVPTWVREQLGDFRVRTAKQIDWRWHIRHQAAFQKHTNLGVSKTINLLQSATPQDISDAYQMMWRLKCKGGTIFRDKCRDEQVIIEKPKSVYFTGHAHDLVPQAVIRPTCRKLPEDADSITHRFRIGKMKCFLTMSNFEDGTLGEIFIRAACQGSTLTGLLDAWSITVSKALQAGTPLSKLVGEPLKGSRFEPYGLVTTKSKRIKVCTSIVDYVVRYLEAKYMPDTAPTAVKNDTQPINGSGSFMSGDICPDCGGPMIYQEGCLICRDRGCGFTKCG